MTTAHWQSRPPAATGAATSLAVAWRFAVRSDRGDGGRLMIHVDMPPDGPATFTAWKELRGQRCDIVPATTVSVTWSTLEGPGWEDRHLEIGASMRTDRAPVRDAAAVPSPGRSRPVRLVAIFRRGSLVYLHSDVPSAAGLLGGTYQLESCTLR